MRSRNWHYSMNIAWSDEDQAYIVSLPEFPGQHTHGATYEEAFTQGLDLLETWIAIYQEDGKPLPQPQVFVSAVQQAS